MNSATLNVDSRIKRSENYILLKTIENEISSRIREEYSNETRALRKENDVLHNQELEFKKVACEVLKKAEVDSKIRVVVQVGVGSLTLQTYEGYLTQKFTGFNTWFDMSDKNRFDGKPFTIGLSCLQYVEILETK